MSRSRSSIKPTRVSRYDGQCIWTSASLDPEYELGSYLGTGSAGVVYEAICNQTKRNFAIKVLNPTGFRLIHSSRLCRCNIISRGISYFESDSPISLKHVWWLAEPDTQNIIAAYHDAKLDQMKEITLLQCVSIWGLDPLIPDMLNVKDKLKKQQKHIVTTVDPRVPAIPAKYLTFLLARRRILREVSSMKTLSPHQNVLALMEAMEFIQDTKSTIFLVLELARGGELFDRINIDYGAEEHTARNYFIQLLKGVKHCHDLGVCHRDLKPENLLLADSTDLSTLKIADFGFSALMLSEEEKFNDNTTRRGEKKFKRLLSHVGTPYYVAPEVQGYMTGKDQGYDGAKADSWSIGVILFAMLAGSLPFEKELKSCQRFQKFAGWIAEKSVSDALNGHCSLDSSITPKDPLLFLDYPQWFFLRHLSLGAKSIISGLLHPDPQARLSVRQALRHPWVRVDENNEELGQDPLDGEEVESSVEDMNSSNSVLYFDDSPVHSEDDGFFESEYSEESVIDKGDQVIKMKTSNLSYSQQIPSLPNDKNLSEHSPSQKSNHQAITADSSNLIVSCNASPSISDFLVSQTSVEYTRSIEKSMRKREESKIDQSEPSVFRENTVYSRRFSTNVEVEEILKSISEIVANDGNALINNISKNRLQEPVINWNSYQLEILFDGILAAVAQVYVVKRASAPNQPISSRCRGRVINEDRFIVEFSRKQMEQHTFEQFFERTKMRFKTMRSRRNKYVESSTSDSASMIE